MSHLVCIVALVSLTACRDSDELDRSPEEEIEALKEKVAKLEKKNDRIGSQFRGVTGSVIRLQNEIEDFGSENWRINVPEVEYEFDRLKEAVSEVERELE